MSTLLNHAPYGPRQDGEFLREMVQLTERHREGCPEYARIVRDWREAQWAGDLPFLHAGLFKHVTLKTASGAAAGRTLESSATGGSTPSRIYLDEESSRMQARSAAAILRDFAGDALRPLLILDDRRSLATRGRLQARVAAALSLMPLASDIYCLLEDSARPESIQLDILGKALERSDDLLLYGFTTALWQSWACAGFPQDVRRTLAGKRVQFIHSGGWKKLEAQRVDRETFDSRVLATAGTGSRVLDCYGLVEQVGMLYPRCEYGYRHVPVWADVLVRDPWTLQAVVESTGQIQLMNVLARGAPYQSVLTEDLGRVMPGECGCGRSGRRFELIGRMPKTEMRGCANV